MKATRSLPLPLEIVEILMLFPAGTGNNLFYRFFYSTSANVPASGLPDGTDLFSDYTDRGEFVGDAIGYYVPVQKRFEAGPLYIKLYVQNDVGGPFVAGSVLAVTQG